MCSRLSGSRFAVSLVVLGTAVMLVVFAASCSRQKTADTTPVLDGPPATIFPMPPLAYTEMGWVLPDAKRGSISDYRGKVLVLDFYATWCAPCRESVPRLVALQEQLGPKGLQIVGLNVGGADDRIKVEGFGKELGIQYPLGFPDKAITDLFLSDDQTIPQTFIFSRDGRLVKRFIGYQQSTGVELEKTIHTELQRR